MSELPALHSRRLRWLVTLATVASIAGLDVVRHEVEPGLLHAWPGHVLTAGIVVLACLALAEWVFGTIGRAQQRLARRNRELVALHEAGLAIAGELRVEAVLQKAVDQARELVGARYGALAVHDQNGRIEVFITSGLSPAERERIGPLPEGRGLLGLVLREGQHLRLADLTTDPRAVGFPPHHPPMRSLLAVPVIHGGAIAGNLYLAEKLGSPTGDHELDSARPAEFTADDEEILERFATQVAIGLANARLHQQIRAHAIAEERERISREMADSLAQVLAYVNTKAQAAQELIGANQPERAAAQIGQLAEAARASYVDVRENVLALGTVVGPERPLLDALRDYLHAWEDQSGVTAELHASFQDGKLPITTIGELQLLRIIQEALANVRKHAGARHAAVWIRAADGWLETVVEDDGAGFDPAALARSTFPRFGLPSMRERAESVDGTLSVDSAPGQGTRVIVRLPSAAPTL